jgi:hypothetical protein
MNDPREPNTSESEVEAYQEPLSEAPREPNTESFQEASADGADREPNTES